MSGLDENQETLQLFLKLVERCGLEASPINFQSKEARYVCPLAYEIRNPDDSAKVIADGSLGERYMNVGEHGDYRRIPTEEEMHRLRLISSEAGIRLIE